MQSTHRNLQITVLTIVGLGLLACAETPTSTTLSRELGAPLSKDGGGTVDTITVVDQATGVTADGDPYIVTIASGGRLDLSPQCSTDDRLHVVGIQNTAATTTLDALAPSRSICNGNAGAGYVFLKLFANETSAAGPCPDVDAPIGTNFSTSSRFFFQTDGPDADTKFDDTQYTLVLKDCTITLVGDDRRVTATVGDLYEGQTSTPLAGWTNIAVNVDVTIK
jgi:hypothetical protein